MNACAESHPSEQASEAPKPLSTEQANELRAQIEAFLNECAQVEASLAPIRAQVTRTLNPERPSRILESS